MMLQRCPQKVVYSCVGGNTNSEPDIDKELTCD